MSKPVLNSHADSASILSCVTLCGVYLLKNETTILYRHFGSSGELLYVGISISALRRITEHRGTSSWFSSVVKIELERFETRDIALQAERVAISAENPLFNDHHSKFPPFSVCIKSIAPITEKTKQIETENAIPMSFSLDLWGAISFSDVRQCLIAIGAIHAEFPLSFELEDENDIDSVKECLPTAVACLYDLLIDSALECGASSSEIGEAYTENWIKNVYRAKQDLEGFAASTLLS